MSEQLENFTVSNSSLAPCVKVYKGAEVSNSIVSEKSIIGEQAIVIDSRIGQNVSLNRRNYVYRSQVGNNSYTGIGAMIRSAKIGAFCSLSWNVSIGGGDHDFDHVTTSPLWRLSMMSDGVQHKENKELQKRFEIQPDCIIGNDVWIATNAIILRNVTIGDGAIIGAGAVVRKDVSPYTIVAGVPAKPIKKRFSDDIIEKLLELAWWDWPIDVIRQHKELIYQEKVDLDVIKRLEEIKNGLN